MSARGTPVRPIQSYSYYSVVNRSGFVPDSTGSTLSSTLSCTLLIRLSRKTNPTPTHTTHSAANLSAVVPISLDLLEPEIDNTAPYVSAGFFGHFTT